jgi:hypothetical protein
MTAAMIAVAGKKTTADSHVNPRCDTESSTRSPILPEIPPEYRAGITTFRAGSEALDP